MRRYGLALILGVAAGFLAGMVVGTICEQWALRGTITTCVAFAVAMATTRWSFEAMERN